jgi:hypothetical protein
MTARMVRVLVHVRGGEEVVDFCEGMFLSTKTRRIFEGMTGKEIVRVELD